MKNVRGNLTVNSGFLRGSGMPAPVLRTVRLQEGVNATRLALHDQQALDWANSRLSICKIDGARSHEKLTLKQARSRKRKELMKSVALLRKIQQKESLEDKNKEILNEAPTRDHPAKQEIESLATKVGSDFTSNFGEMDSSNRVKQRLKWLLDSEED